MTTINLYKFWKQTQNCELYACQFYTLEQMFCNTNYVGQGAFFSKLNESFQGVDLSFITTVLNANAIK